MALWRGSDFQVPAFSIHQQMDALWHHKYKLTFGMPIYHNVWNEVFMDVLFKENAGDFSDVTCAGDM